MKEGSPQQKPQIDLRMLNEQLKEAALMGRPIPIDPYLDFIAANCRPFVQRAQKCGIQYDDLFQIGALAFMVGSTNIDPQGNPISIMRSRIRGAIFHTIRDQGSTLRLPGSIIRNLGNVSFAYGELQQELGRNPSAEEIADRTNIPVHYVTDIMTHLERRGHLIRVQSEQSIDGQGMTYDLLSEIQRHNETSLDDQVTNQVVTKDRANRLLSVLNPVERRIIELSIFHNMSQSQIAPIVGYSQVHVSRLYRIALSKMRDSAHAQSLENIQPVDTTS